MFKPIRNKIPTNPGVYIYKNSEGKIIYIGKAKNLRNRVMSYFTSDHRTSPKTRLLVRNIADFEFIIVNSEVEALLLENRLIKKNKPKYNIFLKDSKTYAYIKITDEKFPRILSTRLLKKDGTYFGPYTDASIRRELIQLAVKLFNVRTCRTLPKKACLNYHIGLCTAPCIDNVNEKEYSKQIEKAKKFLKGNTKGLISELEREMKIYSSEMKFEFALELRNKIEAIKFLSQKQNVENIKEHDEEVISKVVKDDKVLFFLFKISRGVITSKREFRFDNSEDIFLEFVKIYYSQHDLPKEIILSEKIWSSEDEKANLEKYLTQMKGSKVIITNPKIGRKAKLIELATKNANINIKEKTVLEEIKEKFNLPEIPTIIECFDMSNLGKDYLVGALVRWENGVRVPELSRKFQIKSFGGKNDDYASMTEVVYRRYRGILEKRESVELPNLIIIDGGPGQLNAALKSLERLNLKIPIISLAKKEEEIFVPGRDLSYKFDKNSKMMLFIRSIRDSVHNYVVSYNRKKRSMRLKESM